MKSIGIIKILSKYVKFLQESTLKRNVNLMNSLPCKINHLFKEKVKFAAVSCSNTLFSSHITKRWKPWSPNRAQLKLSYRCKTLAPWHTYTHVHSKGCFLSPWKPEHWSCMCLDMIFSLLFYLFTYSLFLICRIPCCLPKQW